MGGLDGNQKALRKAIQGHILLLLLFFFFSFLGLHLRHIEVPKLGVEWEQELPAYATPRASLDLSCVCDLHTAHGNAGSLTH